jgi:hypothetical protein
LNLFGWLLELATDIFNLRTNGKLMSEQLTALKNAYESFRDDIVDKVAGLQLTVVELRSQLESATTDPVEVDRLLKEIEADHLAMVSSVTNTAEIVDP